MKREEIKNILLAAPEETRLIVGRALGLDDNEITAILGKQTQEPEKWAVGSYEFGTISVTLLEDLHNGFFRALIFPKGMRSDKAVQSKKVSPELLDAMEASFAGQHDAVVVTTTPKQEKQKDSRQDVLMKVARSYAVPDDETIVGWGCRLTGVKNAFVWTTKDNRTFRYRLNDQGQLKGDNPIQIVQPSNMGYWAGKVDGKGRNVYHIETV